MFDNESVESFDSISDYTNKNIEHNDDCTRGNIVVDYNWDKYPI